MASSAATNSESSVVNSKLHNINSHTHIIKKIFFKIKEKNLFNCNRWSTNECTRSIPRRRLRRAAAPRAKTSKITHIIFVFSSPDLSHYQRHLTTLKLWENKLNASRAVQTADDSANTNGNSTTAGSGAPTTATNNSSSSGGGGSLRLPTVTKESAAANRASGGGAGNGVNNQNNAPVNNNTNNSDIKPDMDSATRSALHALSQSAYPNQHHHQQHHHHQQQPHHDTNIRTNGKKPLHTPQLDGGIDGSSSDDDDDEDGLTNR